MELDELEKRLEWLDSERQKTNSQLIELKNHIASLETIIEKQKDKILVLENDAKSSSNVVKHVSQFDETLSQTKSDLLKQISELEKKQNSQLKGLEKQQKDENISLNKKFSELQSQIPMVAEVKKNLQLRIDEEIRLTQKVDTLEKQSSGFKETAEGMVQLQKRLSDEMQFENKRAADLQVETMALRKRLDEERNRGDVNVEALRKIESRLGDIQGQETERKLAQTAFIEKLSLAQLERDKLWKEWQARFGEMDSLGVNFSAQLDALETTHRAVKSSQNEFDDVNQRLERRINELTEMHRLTEERFRQEWLSFKTDDQKRWTNYVLTQEEQQQDDTRQMGKLLERVVVLEDAMQETSDTISLINEETEKRLKGDLSLLHELLESFDQTFNKR